MLEQQEAWNCPKPHIIRGFCLKVTKFEICGQIVLAHDLPECYDKNNILINGWLKLSWRDRYEQCVANHEEVYELFGQYRTERQGSFG